VEAFYFFLVLFLFFALPAILKRLKAREEQARGETPESRESPEYRASLEEVKRFLRDMGVEVEERPEGPTVTRPQVPEVQKPGVEPRAPVAERERAAFIEEGREPRRRPRIAVERVVGREAEVEQPPVVTPRARPAAKPVEEAKPKEVPLLEPVSEMEPLVREGPWPRREVRRPPRPARARVGPPSRKAPPVKKEVARRLKILPVRLSDLPRAVVMAEVLGRPRGFGPYRPRRPAGRGASL